MGPIWNPVALPIWVPIWVPYRLLAGEVCWGGGGDTRGAPRVFGEMGYLFSWSWGELVIIMGSWGASS